MDGYLASFDPEIEFHDTPGFPGPGVHHGLEAVRRHAEDYREAWVEPRVETEEIRSVGDRVVTRIYLHRSWEIERCDGRDVG